MTPEELLEAQRTQTPLIEWVREQLVTVDQHTRPSLESCYVASLRDSREKYWVHAGNLRIATAQELLELGGEL